MVMDDEEAVEMDLSANTENIPREMNTGEPRRGYPRRSSMTHEEAQERRASIKAIMRDQTITPHERRRSIQQLMDGRRSSMGTASVASTASIPEDDPYGYGYGDGAPDAYRDATTTPAVLEGMSLLSQGDVCVPISNEVTRRAEQTRPPCAHYKRNCTMIAACCGAAFGCRICHDDSPILPPRLIQKQSKGRYPRSSSMPMSMGVVASQTPEETHHTIDRFAVQEIICRECFTKQSSKT